MIREFRKGLWLDPELVIGISHHDATIALVMQSNGTTGSGWYLNFPGDEQLADEIGDAARIAQKARSVRRSERGAHLHALLRAVSATGEVTDNTLEKLREEFGS